MILGNFLGLGPNNQGMNGGVLLLEKLKNKVAYFSCGCILKLIIIIINNKYQRTVNII
jgi:hypothetical protein